MVVKQILGWLIPIAILLWIIYLMLRKFGLAGEQSETSKEIDEVVSGQMKDIVIARKEISEGKPFDIYYFTKEGNITSLLSVPQARVYAKELYDAIDGWGTDEDTIFSVFSKLTRQTQVSQIAFEYQNMTGNNLASDLVSELDDSDLARVNNLVKKLPVK